MRPPQKPCRQFFLCLRMLLRAARAHALVAPLAGAPRASGVRARVPRELRGRRVQQAALSVLLLGPPASARRTRTRATAFLYLLRTWCVCATIFPNFPVY